MSHQNNNPSRRKFVKLGIAGLASVPMSAWLVSSAHAAQHEQPAFAPIDENDPHARALGYVHDASDVDTKRFPVRATKAGGLQFCRNCQLYTGVEGKEWGPCGIFSYRTDPKTGNPLAVNANGWCVSWGPRADFIARVPAPKSFPGEYVEPIPDYLIGE